MTENKKLTFVLDIIDRLEEAENGLTYEYSSSIDADIEATNAEMDALRDEARKLLGS